MYLGNIWFPPILGASGVQGFFGEGYPFHDDLEIFPGFDFTGMGFVSKTTTLKPRLRPDLGEGNLELEEDGLTPVRMFPNCVRISFRTRFRHVINAVGLSGPGAERLFEDGRWQQNHLPFMVSFGTVGKKAEEREGETIEFVELFKSHLPRFSAPVALQSNHSCPNVKVSHGGYDAFVREVSDALEIQSRLGIPVMIKLSVTTPPHVAMEISRHPACSGICISNTIPWGAFPERIKWKNLFGTEESPLKKYGGGGLSGPWLLPLVIDWVREIRYIGFKKAINAGGGVFRPRDVNRLIDAGADSVALGTVAMLRPWRVKKIIARAYHLERERTVRHAH